MPQTLGDAILGTAGNQAAPPPSKPLSLGDQILGTPNIGSPKATAAPSSFGDQILFGHAPSPTLGQGPSVGQGPDESDRMGENEPWWNRPIQTHFGIGEYREGAGPVERGVEKFGSGLLTPLNLGLMVATGGLGGIAEAGAAEAGELGASAIGRGLSFRAGENILSRLAPETAQTVAKSAGTIAKLANLGFTGMQIKGVAEALPRLQDAIKAGDTDTALEMGTEALLGGAVAGLSSAHLIHQQFGRGKLPAWTQDKEALAAYQQPTREYGVRAYNFEKSNKELIRNPKMDMAALLYHEAGGNLDTIKLWRDQLIKNTDLRSAVREKWDKILDQAQNLPDNVKQLSGTLRPVYTDFWGRLKDMGKVHPDANEPVNYAGQHEYLPDDATGSDLKYVGSPRATKTPGFLKHRSYESVMDALMDGWEQKSGLAASHSNYLRRFGEMKGLTDAEAKLLSLKGDDGRALAISPAAVKNIDGKDAVRLPKDFDVSKGDVRPEGGQQTLISRPLTARGNQDLVDAVDRYIDQNKIREIADRQIVPVDPRARDIADAYQAMKHDPQNPAVQASYNALKEGIKKQWDYATKTLGIKFEPVTADPYAGSSEMMRDVRENNRLKFWKTPDGTMDASHPLAQVDPETGLTYNDLFRAVHDLFGHATEGHEFGPKGEENAWNAHRRMFDRAAIPALTTETKGQNSWVNFGAHLRDAEGKIAQRGEPGYVEAKDRPFAEQKAGLLPKRFWIRPDDEPSSVAARPVNNVLREARNLTKPAKEPSKSDLERYPYFLDVDGTFRRGMEGVEHPTVAGNVLRNAGVPTGVGKGELFLPHTHELIPLLQHTGMVRVGRAGDFEFASMPTDAQLRAINDLSKNLNSKFGVFPGRPEFSFDITDKNGAPSYGKGTPADLSRALSKAYPDEEPTSLAARRTIPSPDQLKEQEGTTKSLDKANWITEDGELIPRNGIEHDIQLGGKLTDNLRELFIQHGKAIRVLWRRGRGGDEFAFTIPNEGVTYKQLGQLKRAAEIMPYGNVYIETVGERGNPELPRTQYIENPTGAKIEGAIRRLTGIRDETESVAARKPAPTAPEDILSHIRERKPFAILQAENPNNVRISDAENRARTVQLLDDLKAKGYKPVEVEGNTKDVEGQKEHAFFVPGIKTADSAELARKYGQAGILTHDGLYWLGRNPAGDYINPTDNTNMFAGNKAREQQYFTVLKGENGKKFAFSLPVDFNQRMMARVPRGATTPLLDRPLRLPAENQTIEELGRALQNFTVGRSRLSPLSMASEDPEALVGRARSLGAAELGRQLLEENSGRDWYSTEIGKMEREFERSHPELVGEPKMHGFLKGMIAAASLGNDSYSTMQLADEMYSLYKGNGRVPLSREDGTDWPAQHSNANRAVLSNLQAILEHVGGNPEKAYDWMISKHPVSELVQVRGGKSVAGKASDMRYGAYALSPKAGAFWLNLNGIEEALTMDKWATRTWNRWMGTLINDRGEVQEAPKSEGERQLATRAFKELGDMYGLSTREAQAALWYYEQQLYKAHGIDIDAGVSYGDAAKEHFDEKLGTVQPGRNGEGRGSAEAGRPAAQYAGVPEGNRPTAGQVPAGDLTGAQEGDTSFNPAEFVAARPEARRQAAGSFVTVSSPPQANGLKVVDLNESAVRMAAPFLGIGDDWEAHNLPQGAVLKAADRLQKMADTFDPGSVSSKQAGSLAQSLREAAEHNGTAGTVLRMTGMPEARANQVLDEELYHAGQRAAGEGRFTAHTPQVLDRLSNNPLEAKASQYLQQTQGYPDNAHVTALETEAHILSGQFMDLTPDEARQLMYEHYEALKEAHGDGLINSPNEHAQRYLKALKGLADAHAERVKQITEAELPRPQAGRPMGPVPGAGEREAPYAGTGQAPYSGAGAGAQGRPVRSDETAIVPAKETALGGLRGRKSPLISPEEIRAGYKPPPVDPSQYRPLAKAIYDALEQRYVDEHAARGIDMGTRGRTGAIHSDFYGQLARWDVPMKEWGDLADYVNPSGMRGEALAGEPGSVAARKGPALEGQEENRPTGQPKILSRDGKLYLDVSDYKQGPSVFSRWRMRGINQNGEGIYDQKPLLIHPDYLDSVNKAFNDSSWFRKNPIMNAALKAGGQVKRTLLSFSPFHMTTEYLRGLQMGLNPLEALRPKELTPDRDAVTAKFGPTLVDTKSRSLYQEGVGGSTELVHKIPFFGKLQKAAEDKLFGDYIPRLKADAWDKVVDQLDKRHENWSTDQKQFMASKIVDAAFGGLNWKMLGVSMNSQDALRLVMLAPDFTGSQLLFAKYGTGPGGSVVNQSFARIALYNFAVARVLNMLVNGKAHMEHPFGVVSPDDKKTWSVRTMPEDIFHALTDPRGFAYNRLNPLTMRTAWEALSGRDQRGKAVDAQQQIHDLLRNVVPIPGQNLVPAFRPPDQTIAEGALRSLGLNAQPNTSTAFKAAAQLASNHAESGPVDQAKLEHHQRLIQYEDAIRGGKVPMSTLSQAVVGGQISVKDAKAIQKNVQETREMDDNTAKLYTRSARLPMPEFLNQVWAVATPQEKAVLTPLLIKKRAAYLKQVMTEMTPAQRMQDPTVSKLLRMFPQQPAF